MQTLKAARIAAVQGIEKCLQGMAAFLRVSAREAALLLPAYDVKGSMLLGSD